MESPEFWQGIEQFNQEEFYDCHDTLEAIWMDAIATEKNFYQGILQIAVACYHLGNYNWRGAVTLLGEGVRRLSSFQPSYADIDVSGLVSQSYELLQQLQQIEPDRVQFFVENLSQNQPFPFPKIQIIQDS
jgi:predicted metal-dependent hydrolase